MVKKLEYLIAYTDSQGNDFHGLPWVVAPFPSFFEANSFCQQLLADGLTKDAFVFSIRYGACPEEISWEFARKHRVDS